MGGEALLPATPLLAGTGVFLQVERGGRRGVRELGLRSRNVDGNLVPGTRVLGLGDKLEAVRDVEGPPSLVAIRAGGTGVTRLAAVGAETGVEAAAAFLLSKRRAESPGGIDVHSVGCRGWLLVLLTIILNNIVGVSEATRVAQRIVERVRKLRGFSDTQEGRSGVSTSIGIAFRGPNHFDAAVLLRRADAALYRAKRNGRDSFVCDTTHAGDAIGALDAKVTVDAVGVSEVSGASEGARRDR